MLIISVMSAALIISLVGTCFAHKLGSLPYRVVTTPISIKLASVAEMRTACEAALLRITHESAIACEQAAAADNLAAQVRAASRRLTAPSRLAEFMASDSMEIDLYLVSDLNADDTATMLARCYTI